MFNDAQRQLALARDILAGAKDRKLAISRLRGHGLSDPDARLLIETVYRQNMRENRKTAGWKFLVGAVSAALAAAIFYFTGRLYILLLLGSAGAILWALGEIIAASGFELRQHLADD